MIDMRIFQLGAIASIFLVISATPTNNRPGYVDCLNSNECGRNECCTIGLGRFSIPQCQKKLDYGETCKPDNEPQDSLTLTYPENSTITLQNFYYRMCPCMAGLVCSRKTGLCEDITKHELFNYIDYY